MKDERQFCSCFLIENFISVVVVWIRMPRFQNKSLAAEDARFFPTIFYIV